MSTDLPDWLKDLQPGDDWETEEPEPATAPADEPLPDWLQDLRPLEDAPAEPVAPPPQPRRPAPTPAPVAPPPAPRPQPEPAPVAPAASLEEDLLAEFDNEFLDDFDDQEKSPSRQRSSVNLGAALSLGFSPFQMFVLSALLFFDVVVIGLLLLAMMGRIAP